MNGEAKNGNAKSTFKIGYIPEGSFCI